MDGDRPQLRALARRAGILDAYQPMGGEPARFASDATRESLLAAMGLDGSTESAASEALRALEVRETSRLLDPIRVAHGPLREGVRIPVRLPPGSPAPVRWQLELRGVRRAIREGRSRRAASTLELPLPATLPLGYHTVRVAVEAGGSRHEAEQRLVVAPRTCTRVGDLLGEQRTFGLIANLYSVRSRRDWGIGDLGDLRQLVEIAAELGAGFVGVNPLHALWNRGYSVSPYSPVSRLYRNELYLAPEAVPELGICEAARRRLVDSGFEALRSDLRGRTHVAYDEVRALKREILVELHRAFVARERTSPSERGRAYAAFRAREGEVLDDFATFVALAEHFRDAGGSDDWRGWPAPYRDPRSEEVGRFRAANGEAVDFHRWVQFELDRQLAEAASTGRDRGLAIGLYHDLAVGTSAAGSDPWAFPGLFAEGASAGAPPDDFSAIGQDWGLPPLVPLALRERGFDYWIRLLRSAFAHAGAIRVDHVMGVSRLFWVPAGGSGADGAYVRYPARELLGILALESHRHRALVIGEDLGTVPTGFAAQMARHAILSSRVLYFERQGGRFRPRGRYSRRALVTPNTHDLPPLAAFFSGRDLELRREAGQIPDDTALDAALRERRETCQQLLRRLVQDGLLEAEEADAIPYPELVGAVLRFLAGTPCPLVGVLLDDLAGEAEPVNLPGVPQERHPSWRRRMTTALEDLLPRPALKAARSALAPLAPAGARREP